MEVKSKTPRFKRIFFTPSQQLERGFASLILKNNESMVLQKEI